VDGLLPASDVPSWGRKQRPATQTVPLQPNTTGLDIAKSVFQVHGEDASGKMVFQKRLRRSHPEVIAEFRPKAEDGCGIANWPHLEAWSQRLKAIPGFALPDDVIPRKDREIDPA
jgi:hypothetical protein